MNGLLLAGFVVLLLLWAVLSDDDDHGRPHTGYLGEDWQNKNQIFVGVIFP